MRNPVIVVAAVTNVAQALLVAIFGEHPLVAKAVELFQILAAAVIPLY